MMTAVKLLALLLATASLAAAFTNPTFASQDPWLIRVNGTYIYAESGCGKADICLKASSTLLGLSTAPWVGVWSHSGPGNNQGDIWAPEIHYINGRYYIYYAADNGDNNNHHLFVLQAATNNPLGPYKEGDTGIAHGQLSESTGNWAIDPDVFTAADGKLYITWSCTNQHNSAFPQRICLAPMYDPLHMGPTVFLSTPTEYWETRGSPIQEGPVGYTRNGKTYITYSGSASFIPNDYSVGVLTLEGGNPLVASNWVKSGPVLDRHGTTYGPGSVVFIPSVDDSEYWVLYHGIDRLDCNPAWNCRDIRMQRMYFNEDGYPVLGYPANPGVNLAAPAGEGSPKGQILVPNFVDAFGDAMIGNPQAGKITGSWTQVDRSTASSGLGGAWDQIFSPSNPNPQVFTTHVEVKLVQTGTTQGYPKYGVYCAYDNSNNHVEMMIDTKFNVIATHGVVNGAEAAWQNSPLPSGFDATAWHSLDCRKSFSTFTFMLDGQTVQTRTINLINGQAGLVVVDTHADYRNLRVTP